MKTFKGTARGEKCEAKTHYDQAMGGRPEQALGTLTWGTGDRGDHCPVPWPHGTHGPSESQRGTLGSHCPLSLKLMR